MKTVTAEVNMALRFQFLFNNCIQSIQFFIYYSGYKAQCFSHLEYFH